jgi:hypothetical protein
VGKLFLAASLSIKFASTTYHDLEPKLDAIMTGKGFEKVDAALYRHEDGREVMICRLGSTIKAVWIENTVIQQMS